jgi:hypothetical protein
MRQVIGALLGTMLLAGSAAAATPGTSQPPPTAEPGQQGVTGNQPLSNKLAQSNGVLKPPGTDQAMVQHPENKGTMPVIPPPGTPQNQPGVVAK